MQDGGDSTPKNADEPGSIKPERDSEHFDAGDSQSEQPDKVYDYYHQHFGVALAAGSQDVRNAEAGSRAAYAQTAEVADKPKSDSWNALKSLIRYQTSTTKEPEPKETFTTSGDSFEAQWLSKSSDDLPALAGPEPEAVRLKWTPIVDNVPEARWSKSEKEVAAEAEAEAIEAAAKAEKIEAEAEAERVAAKAAAAESEARAAAESEARAREIAEIAAEAAKAYEAAEAAKAAKSAEAETAKSAEASQEATEEATEAAAVTSQQSYEEALAATARGGLPADAAKPGAKKIFDQPYRMGRRPVPRPKSSEDKNYEEALAATARGEQPALPLDEVLGSAPHATNEVETTDRTTAEASSVLNDMDALFDSPSQAEAANHDVENVSGVENVSEVEDGSEHDAAEVRSKFGSMNAFARMQKRTKEQVETKEEQSITGDIPDEVQDEVQAGNWETKPAAEAESTEGAAVLNQWCSTSTGDSLPALPSLDELNSIPTPSVMKDGGAQPKPFSLSTPKPSSPEDTDVTPDMMRHQAARTSWLKAASEYSSSVIKAVTEQMKMLSAKPKKTTPESPEFHTAELPEASEEDP